MVAVPILVDDYIFLDYYTCMFSVHTYPISEVCHISVHLFTYRHPNLLIQVFTKRMSFLHKYISKLISVRYALPFLFLVSLLTCLKQTNY